ncbi:MAG: hypothetical protein M3083_15070 [Actinomycetota bacterium]|nr:hypothetical protein [Actinomycetota bacterium]
MPEPSMRELEVQLREMASEMSWPATPDLAAAAAERLSGPSARRSHRLGRKVLLAAVVVAAVLGVSLAVSPGARRAAADLLGLRSVHISTGPPPPIPTTVTPPPPLDLGQAVTLTEAARRVGFAVRIPNLPVFDQPDGVSVSTPPPEGEVTLMYRPRADLPASAQTGVGLLLTEFQGTMEAGFFGKVAEPGTTIEALAVHRQPAYWLAGAPHAFFYRTAKGGIYPDTLRLATNTLIWQAGPVTLRVEGDITKEQALAIADSLP